MRLRDLHAQFVYDVSAGGMKLSLGPSVAGMQGTMFQCPLCGAGKGRRVDDEQPYTDGAPRGYLVGAHYIEVLFSNPRGVAPAPADAGVTDGNGGHPRWQIVSGSTLDDLTLAPSINCDIPWKDDAGVEHPSSCKFHGWVRSGDAA